MIPRLIISFTSFLSLVLCNTSGNWSIENGYNPVIDKNYIFLSNTSTNEERITSERVRGKFTIYCDGVRLSLSINWGEYANLSTANVYYYISKYGLWEDNWKMSNSGEISYASDPLLLLMQLTTTDSLAIGIRPKYINEIRYYFNINGLAEIIKSNQDIFGEYSQIISNVFHDSDKTSGKMNQDNMLNDYISKESDIRSLREKLFDNDKFVFRPIWYESKLEESHNISADDSKIIYYNRWLKKKGTLFTHKDIRVTRMFVKAPKIIPYKDITEVEIKGNIVSGYRLHINNRYLTRFSRTEKVMVEQIKKFIINRSIYSKTS